MVFELSKFELVGFYCKLASGRLLEAILVKSECIITKACFKNKERVEVRKKYSNLVNCN